MNYVFINNKTLFYFLLLIGATVLPLFTFAAEDSFPSPTITINPDIYYPIDEILYLEGRAGPNSSVQIQFQKPGAKHLRFVTKSDQSGEWVLAEKVPLEAGDWEARARIIAGEKASEWSNPRVFKVLVSGVTIGGFNIKFAFLVLVILVILIFGLGMFWYFIARLRRLQARLMAKEIHEVHESLHEGLSDIRRDILDDLKILESSGKPLSQEEISRKDHMLRELDRIEKNMGREMEDVEEKL